MEVMNDPEARARHPQGFDGNDMLAEIRKKKGDNAFPFVSILDVIDEMRVLFGPGRPAG